MSGLYPDVASMLAAHGIDATEIPFAHEGYSGATMTASSRMVIST